MNDIELLLPVGSYESLIAAVQNGANAVYFGAKSFNARQFANNFDDETLKNAITYAKMRNVKTYLTLNILIKNEEINEALALVNTAYSFGIDAIIIQDLGLATLIHKYFPDLSLHASTQMAIHNLDGVKHLEQLGFKRVVLARELSIDEIKYICENSNIEIECFIHGALCISYSGQCLFSSLVGNRSGNRGQCAGPCRQHYTLYSNEKAIRNGYLLSTKDLCAINNIPELISAGIKSLKIEGRMKQPEYVGLVASLYRKAIDNVSLTDIDYQNLLQIFNRGNFTKGLLFNEKDITYPTKPKNQGIPLGKVTKNIHKKNLIEITLMQNISIGDGIETMDMSCSTVITEIVANGKNTRYANKDNTVLIGNIHNELPVGTMIYRTSSKELLNNVTETYRNKNNATQLINLTITIKKEKPVSVCFNNEHTYISEVIPEASISSPLTHDSVIKQFNKTNGIPFSFNYAIDLDDNLFLPVSELNKIRSKALNEYANILENRIERKKVNLATLPIPVANIRHSDKQIHIYLNILPKEITTIPSVDCVYIPYRLFITDIDTIKKLRKSSKVFMAISNILQKEINIAPYINDIDGLLLANIAQIDTFKNISLPKHLDYTCNIFNSYTLDYYKKVGIDSITVSPELNIEEINNIGNVQVICYGRIKCMTIKSCIIKDCNNCPTNTYCLKDNLNYSFPIITDKTNCTMNIFNSKILSFSPKKILSNTIRLDFFNESINEISEIINMYKSGTNPEGNIYTNGNFKKDNI